MNVENNTVFGEEGRSASESLSCILYRKACFRVQTAPNRPLVPKNSLVVTGGALGKILDVAFRAWAARNQKGEVKVSPSPLLTQQQGPFVTVGECKQHRCALEKRIDALGPALNRIFKKLSENDRRGEDRSLQLHRRLDPVVEKVAATAATVEMMKGKQ